MPDRPPVILAVDECQEWAAGPASAEAAAIVADLVRMGRPAAVVVTAARSRPGERVLTGPRCPVHPAAVLTPFPGGAARGLCPVDGASHQCHAPEVTP